MAQGLKSACQFRRLRFDPWTRKIPHAVEQLGPGAATTEPTHARRLRKPVHPDHVFHSKRSCRNEKPAHRHEVHPTPTGHN